MITLNNKTFFYKSWYDKGLKYVEHVFDFRINQFYSFENFKEIYGIQSGDYLKYLTLIQNIPQTIKINILLDNTKLENSNESTINSFIKAEKANRYLYEYLIKREQIYNSNSAENK